MWAGLAEHGLLGDHVLTQVFDVRVLVWLVRVQRVLAAPMTLEFILRK